MPYDSLDDLPNNVKSVLPKHGLEIYRAVFNNAWEEYKDPEDRKGNASREEVARRVAWAAVKKQYEQNDSGRWVKKS